MKKAIYLLGIVFSVCFQSLQAQQMPAPDPNMANVLFLKFSTTLNSNNSYYPDDQIRLETEAIWGPAYTYVKTIDATNIHYGRVVQKFYVPNPDDFAYIDPATYNSVSLDLVQLATVLKPKNEDQRKAYLNSFHEIYLIDYEQKNPKAASKVKIMRVKPCDFWF